MYLLNTPALTISIIIFIITFIVRKNRMDDIVFDSYFFNKDHLDERLSYVILLLLSFSYIIIYFIYKVFI